MPDYERREQVKRLIRKSGVSVDGLADWLAARGLHPPNRSLNSVAATIEAVAGADATGAEVHLLVTDLLKLAELNDLEDRAGGDMR